MRLFKNIDIQDLDRILKEGILSANKANNKNWESGNRSDNSEDLVYLFSPNEPGDAFPKYGLILLEVEASASENEIDEDDFYFGRYREYVCEKVPASDIKGVYAPELFKDEIKTQVSAETFNRIRFVEIKADYWEKTAGALTPADTETLQTLKKSPLNSTEFNFLRGIKKIKRSRWEETVEVVDFYNFEYKI